MNGNKNDAIGIRRDEFPAFFGNEHRPARTDCAAVAPRQTTIFGFTTSSSASSQGLHDITCLIDGF
jgi:hypothetical protein